MIAVIDETTGQVERIAQDTDGLDLAGKVVVALPQGFDPVLPSHIHADGAWHENMPAHRARALAGIKAEAATRIEAFAPQWRQSNDLRQPSPEGAARFARIDAIRAWSNQAETAIATAQSVAELESALEQIADGLPE